MDRKKVLIHVEICVLIHGGSVRHGGGDQGHHGRVGVSNDGNEAGDD